MRDMKQDIREVRRDIKETKRRLAVVFARALFFCVGCFDYWLELARADGANAGLLQKCD